MSKKIFIVVILFIVIGLSSIFLFKGDNKVDNKITTTSTTSTPQTTTTTTTKVTQPVLENVSIMSKEKYNNLSYLLYKPSNEDVKKPLIVYLHNSKVQGNDLDLVLKNGLPKYLSNGSLKVDAYVIMPQLSKKYGRWSSIRSDVKSLIDFVVKNYNIDEDKISLTGHSLGGRETFEFAINYPDYFYKLAPLSANVSVTDKNVNKLKNTPVWAFVGTNDTVVSPNVSKDFITRLKNINNNAKITEIKGANHLDVADKAFKNYDLLEWLIN